MVNAGVQMADDEGMNEDAVRKDREVKLSPW